MLSNSDVQYLDIGFGFATLLLKYLQNSRDCFAEIHFKFVDGISLRVATREGWDFGPEAAFGVFVDDCEIVCHESILAYTSRSLRLESYVFFFFAFLRWV